MNLFFYSGELITCLNEYHLFLLLAGAFIGYSHSFLGVVQNMYYVSFQPIQVSTWFFNSVFLNMLYCQVSVKNNAVIILE